MNKTDYFGHTPPFGKRCPVCNCEVEDGKWRIIRPSGLWVCGKCIIDMLAEQIKETYGEVDSIWLNIKKRDGRYRAVIMVGVQE